MNQIFLQIDHFGMDMKPWNGIGSYFKFCSFQGQPVWCSYDITPFLHDIKLHTFAVITDQDDNLMYVYEQGELKNYH